MQLKYPTATSFKLVIVWGDLIWKRGHNLYCDSKIKAYKDYPPIRDFVRTKKKEKKMNFEKMSLAKASCIKTRNSADFLS